MVSCGRDFTLAVSTKHDLFVWGRNKFGQLGLGDREKRLTPIQLNLRLDGGIDGHQTSPPRATCGARHVIVVWANTVWVWG